MSSSASSVQELNLQSSGYYRLPISFLAPQPSSIPDPATIFMPQSKKYVSEVGDHCAKQVPSYSLNPNFKPFSNAEELPINRKRSAVTPLPDAFDPIVDPAVVALARHTQPSQNPRKRPCPAPCNDAASRPVAAPKPNISDVYALLDRQNTSMWTAQFILHSILWIPHDDASVQWHRDLSAITEAAASSILLVAKRCSLSLSTIFLATWYIARLVPEPIVKPHCVNLVSLQKLIERVFFLGALLANKWLDEPCWGTLQWSRHSDLTIASFKRVERLGLIALQHNLSISNEQWRDWLISLNSHPSLNAGLSTFARSTVRFQMQSVLSDLLEHHSKSSLLAEASLLPPLGSVASLHSELLSGLDLNYKGHGHPPTDWFPPADPVILDKDKVRRNSYGAIGRPPLSRINIPQPSHKDSDGHPQRWASVFCCYQTDLDVSPQCPPHLGEYRHDFRFAYISNNYG